MSWVKTWEGRVERDWLDDLDHVNFLTYQRIADEASLAVWREARGAAATAPALEFVMTETHVRYLNELRLGAAVEIRTALTAYDTKRFQLIHRIESGGDLVCIVETLNLCFDPLMRRAANFTAAIIDRFEASMASPNDATPQLSIKRRAAQD